jgi:hypothetical protein
MGIKRGGRTMGNVLIKVRCTEQGCQYERMVTVPSGLAAEFADRDPLDEQEAADMGLRVVEDLR